MTSVNEPLQAASGTQSSGNDWRVGAVAASMVHLTKDVGAFVGGAIATETGVGAPAGIPLMVAAGFDAGANLTSLMAALTQSRSEYEETEAKLEAVSIPGAGALIVHGVIDNMLTGGQNPQGAFQLAKLFNYSSTAIGLLSTPDTSFSGWEYTVPQQVLDTYTAFSVLQSPSVQKEPVTAAEKKLFGNDIEKQMDRLTHFREGFEREHVDYSRDIIREQIDRHDFLGTGHKEYLA